MGYPDGRDAVPDWASFVPTDSLLQLAQGRAYYQGRAGKNKQVYHLWSHSVINRYESYLLNKFSYYYHLISISHSSWFERRDRFHRLGHSILQTSVRSPTVFRTFQYGYPWQFACIRSSCALGSILLWASTTGPSRKRCHRFFACSSSIISTISRFQLFSISCWLLLIF